ncbi:MAG TPA: MarR family transcriptional regulator [Sporichthyaceae bacterium]|nr:MarR family transcriptional regulator [Sporichthyaceae bacterium]
MDNGVEAVLAASRVLMGVVADSVAPVSQFVTMSQYRVLVIVATHGPLNLNSVAGALGVHPSNATRACDRLVEAGLLARTESPIDRRRVDLALTDSGVDLIGRVMDHRRAAIEGVLARMTPHAREELAIVLGDFAAAADEPAMSLDDWAADLLQTAPLAAMG